MDNVSKSKTTICQPGAICTGMSEEAFSWRITGEVATYREHLRQNIPYPDCGVDLTSGSMTYHCRQLYVTDPSIDWD